MDGKDRVHCVPSGRKLRRWYPRANEVSHRFAGVAAIHGLAVVVPQILYRTLSSSAAEGKPKIKQGAYRRRMKRLVRILGIIRSRSSLRIWLELGPRDQGQRLGKILGLYTKEADLHLCSHDRTHPTTYTQW